MLCPQNIGVRVCGRLGGYLCAQQPHDRRQGIVYGCELFRDYLLVELSYWASLFKGVFGLSRDSYCDCPVMNNFPQKFGRRGMSSGNEFMEKSVVGGPKLSAGCFAGELFSVCDARGAAAA